MTQGADTIQEVTELRFVLGDMLLERLMANGIVLDHTAKSVRICISLDAETKKRITVKPLPEPKSKKDNKKVRKKKSR